MAIRKTIHYFKRSFNYKRLSNTSTNTKKTIYNSNNIKHQSPAAIRDKRTVSIPSLTYYHSKFSMKLIRKKPKKRPSPCWLQMVRSLPVEHRYKFGICPKDCRYVHCDISGKIALNETLMFLAMMVYYQLM